MPHTVVRAPPAPDWTPEVLAARVERREQIVAAIEQLDAHGGSDVIIVDDMIDTAGSSNFTKLSFMHIYVYFKSIGRSI